MKGKYCERCTGTVDSNEYNFLMDMCKDCAKEIKEKEERINSFVSNFVETDNGQIDMGKILV